MSKKEKDTYKIVEENADKRTKVYELSTGKRMPTGPPKFVDRDDVYEVIKKAQKGDKLVAKIVERVSREKNATAEEVYDMIRNGGEGLSEKEMAGINEATSNTEIKTKDMTILIRSILNLNPEEKELFINELDLFEGVEAVKIAMTIYSNTMVGEEERKK